MLFCLFYSFKGPLLTLSKVNWKNEVFLTSNSEEGPSFALTSSFHFSIMRYLLTIKKTPSLWFFDGIFQRSDGRMPRQRLGIPRETAWEPQRFAPPKSEIQDQIKTRHENNSANDLLACYMVTRSRRFRIIRLKKPL